MDLLTHATVLIALRANRNWFVMQLLSPYYWNTLVLAAPVLIVGMAQVVTGTTTAELLDDLLNDVKLCPWTLDE